MREIVNFFRQWEGKEWGNEFRLGGGFNSKDFIKFVILSQSLDNRYPMQAYMVGYATNIDKIS